MSKKPFLSELLVDKKYIPSSEELSKLVDKINYPQKLKNTTVIESPDPTLIFDTLENSRLFLAKLGVPIGLGFFEPVPLTEINLVGNFTVGETYHVSGIEVKFINIHGEGLFRIKSIIRETMPELADKINNFS